eukprot:761439-Hanusia_phi.AAC.8
MEQEGGVESSKNSSRSLMIAEESGRIIIGPGSGRRASVRPKNRPAGPRAGLASDGARPQPRRNFPESAGTCQ